jgi:hypothetical protein
VVECHAHIPTVSILKASSSRCTPPGTVLCLDLEGVEQPLWAVEGSCRPPVSLCLDLEGVEQPLWGQGRPAPPGASWEVSILKASSSRCGPHLLNRETR